MRRLQPRAGRLECTLSGTGPATNVLLNGAGVTLEGCQGLYPDIERSGHFPQHSEPALAQAQVLARLGETAPRMLAAGG